MGKKRGPSQARQKKRAESNARRRRYRATQGVLIDNRPASQRTFPSGVKMGRPPKPEGERRVSHGKRGEVPPACPVLVTMRLRPGLPNLRKQAEMECILACLEAAKDRNGMRITEYTVQANHMHVIVEVDPYGPGTRKCPARTSPGEGGKAVLAAAIGGLKVRLAKGLNKVWRRSGAIWGDRYHAAIKSSPTEVRRAKAYVLNNGIKHGFLVVGIDIFSSGPWFQGWAEEVVPPAFAAPVSEPQTWLGSVGWLQRGGGPIPVPS